MNNIVNISADTRTSAARFIAEHENLQMELTSARLTLDDQRKEIERLDAKISIQNDMLAQANTDKNTYLQYSFELAAQLQFIVAGSARALMIAAQVRNRIAMQASNIPPVPGADIAELEDILHRIGEHNDKAGDGNGLTNDDWRNANGAADAPKPLTAEQIKAIGDNIAPYPIAAGSTGEPVKTSTFNTLLSPEALLTHGTLVDRDGNPIEMSPATKLMMPQS